MPYKSAITEAPYDEHGLQHYPDKHAEWRRIESFIATMTLSTWRRGRSAAYFMWADEDGRHYPMFMADLNDLLTGATITKGSVRAVWTVRKRGSNYGIQFVREATA
jgi:hypothetical protein